MSNPRLDKNGLARLWRATQVKISDMISSAAQTNQPDWNSTSGYSKILNKPESLSDLGSRISEDIQGVVKLESNQATLITGKNLDSFTDVGKYYFDLSDSTVTGKPASFGSSGYCYLECIEMGPSNVLQAATELSHDSTSYNKVIRLIDTATISAESWRIFAPTV